MAKGGLEDDDEDGGEAEVEEKEEEEKDEGEEKEAVGGEGGDGAEEPPAEGGEAAAEGEEGVAKKKKKSKQIDPIQLEAERLKKLEAQKKREENLRIRLREKYEEEQKMSKYNKRKIDEVWLHILRKIKAEELQKEIEVLIQVHDQQVDRKDAIIQMLYRDLSESEEQYRLALRTHVQHLDELIELNSKRVFMMEEEFNKDLDQLKHEFQIERHEIIERFNEELQEVQEIQKEMESRSNNTNHDIQKDFLRYKEAIRTKYSEMYKVMTLKLDKKIKEYSDRKKAEQGTYIQQYDSKFKDYMRYRQSDDEMSAEIKDQQYKIKDFEEKLKNWKSKWLNNVREYEERNEKLTEERKILIKHYNTLKTKMTAFRDQQKKKLTELVKMASQTKKNLEAKLEIAERLLKLAELNRKLETESERQYATKAVDVVLTGEEQQALEADLLEEDAFVAEKQQGGLPEWEKLGKFYSKYNKVLLDKMALTQEKQYLLSENEKLRHTLKRYLDGISVNQDVLGQQNSLLMVKNVEGKHEMIKQMVQAGKQASKIALI